MADRKSSPSFWSLLEIPLALISFVFFRVARVLFRALSSMQLQRKPELAHNWRVLSGPALSRPLVLPLVMTTGPRWNPHAVIGTVGPLDVRSKISFDREAVARCARSWTAVINHFPDYQTVTRLAGGEGIPFAPPELELDPGKYTIIFRYYLLRGDPVYPKITVDGKDVVPEAGFPQDINRFYEGFGARSRPLYMLLHFYVTTLLRLRGWVSEQLIARELLPVGNPETGFLYDAFKKGERVRIVVAPELLATHLIFYTMYGRDSFPFYSDRVLSTKIDSPPALRDGFYLLRCHPMVPKDQQSAGLSAVRSAVITS